jgi:hypothetical protein
MNRLTLVLVLAVSLGCAVWAARAFAFDTNSESAINPDGTARFADPDDQPLPGLTQVAPDIQDYQGTLNQPTPSQLTTDQPGIFPSAPRH